MSGEAISAPPFNATEAARRNQIRVVTKMGPVCYTELGTGYIHLDCIGCGRGETINRGTSGLLHSIRYHTAMPFGIGTWGCPKIYQLGSGETYIRRNDDMQQ